MNINFYKEVICWFFMDKNYLYIGEPGINDLIEKFPLSKNDLYFPNLNASYFGKLLRDYFSFGGFYEVRNSSHKSIKLKKLTKSSKYPEEYSILNLEFHNVAALQTFGNEGTSIVKGEVFSKDLEGTIRKIGRNKYEILLNVE